MGDGVDGPHVVGVPLEVLSALRANTPWDYGAQLFSSVGFAVPDFLEAVLLIYFFAAKWGHITGLPTSGWDTWQSKVLPVITLSLTPMTYFARLVRGSMLETLQQDYVRTARAKGLRRHRIVGLHVLRNSLIPAVTAAAPLLGYIITGSFIVENIFAIPGIGQYYVTSVTGQDYAVVMGLTVLLSVIIIIANMVADIMYGSGTSGYNHGTRDTLGYGIGLGIPGSLYGYEFDRSLTNLPSADLPLVIARSIAPSTPLASSL